MNKKIFKILLVAILFIFIGKVRAGGFPTSVTITGNAQEHIGFNGSQVTTYWDWDDVKDSVYPHSEYKTDGKHTYICSQYTNDNTPIGSTCDVDNKDVKIEMGIASILKAFKLTTPSSDVNRTNYYFAQIAINEFLGEYSTSGKYIESYLPSNYATILSTAKNQNAPTTNLTSNSGNTTLTFTKNNEGNYEANVSITTGTEITKVTASEGMTCTKTAGDSTGSLTYKCTIASNKLNVGENALSVKFENKAASYDYSKYYYCKGNQNVVIAEIYTQPVAAKNITFSGIINVPGVTIKKVDKDTKERLNGVTLQLLKSDKSEMSCTIIGGDSPNNSKCSWKTNSTDAVIKNLPAGTYYIREISTVPGYKKNTTDQKITVKGTGNESFTMENEKTKVDISKSVVSGASEIEGAHLALTSSNGGVLACSYLKDDGTIDRMTKCEWISGGHPKTIVGLKAGKYKLTETSPALGYELAPSSIEFQITEEGKVLDSKGKVIEAKANTNPRITMINEYTKLTITKINSVDGKPLKGAKLKLLDADKKEMKGCFYLDSKDSRKPLSKCEWTSDEKGIILLGLIPGTYYLQELEAPEGYVLNDKLLEITIDENGTSKEVEMVNELEVKVPNTLSTRSTLLLTIAMFDIALGLGILTYVKKNKIEE